MEREELFCRRMEELADAAYSRGIVTFSDFLDLYELHMIHGMTGGARSLSLTLEAMIRQSVR